MSSDDARYYQQRAEVERVLAGKAANAQEAAVHDALAQKYARFAASLDMGEASRWQGFQQNKCR
jgi:hypothetical protein